jgi:Fic family protein
MDTVTLLSEADAALGRLAGAGRLLPEPHLLILPYMTREAISSSRIEGTQASLSDVFEAAAGGVASEDVAEVQNYVRALQHGLRRQADLPLSLRLLRECHEVLLTGVRGQGKTPGEFRRSQNWIGSPDARPDTAVFVPPTVDDMTAALDDWERFAHDEAVRLPLLVKCALLHYQFETIHPFLDGNGRLGRLFIVLYLVERGRLPAPLLYLSSYLEHHRSEYYDRLQAVRERGEIAEWIQFFLAGVVEQATDAFSRAEQLIDLREAYRQSVQGSRSRANEVIDLMFTNPILTARFVAARLSVTQQGATHLLRALTRAGLLREFSSGRGVRAYWHADGVFDALGE